MKAFILASSAVYALTACTISQDPADGGFLSGIVGVAGGGYQNRIDTLEAQLAADQAEANALAAKQLRLQASAANNATQLRNMQAQLAALQAVVRGQVATLEARGITVNNGLKARVQAVSAVSPSGSSDTARLASLRRAIADARALSADLGRLS